MEQWDHSVNLSIDGSYSQQFSKQLNERQKEMLNTEDYAGETPSIIFKSQTVAMCI